MKTKKYNYQPNQITNSRQEFGLLEKRIVYCIINTLDPSMCDHDLFSNTLVTIPIAALGSSNRKEIRAATDRLQTRRIHLIDDATEYLSIVPFPRVHYRGRVGVIDITVFADVMPHFMKLRCGFTRYQLKAALSLGSTTSQKLYELLCRFKDTSAWRKVEIDQLKYLLNIQDKYAMFSTFRVYVLEASRVEIAKQTDIRFTYTLHKTGRRYTHVDFKIMEQNRRKNPLDVCDPLLDDERSRRALAYLQEFGITTHAVQNEIIHAKQTQFWTWLYHYKQNKAAIRNPAGHLMETLKV